MASTTGCRRAPCASPNYGSSPLTAATVARCCDPGSHNRESRTESAEADADTVPHRRCNRKIDRSSNALAAAVCDHSGAATRNDHGEGRAFGVCCAGAIGSSVGRRD